MDTKADTLQARRRLLKFLALSPLPAFLPALAFAADGPPASSFLRVSSIITGTEGLSQPVADRIEALLTKRDTRFAANLVSLGNVISDGSERSAKLEQLTADQLRFALEIVKPWYLGYVGTPSNSILKDDAEFTTFLEAQSYQKVLREVPRQSYPPGSAGWWGAVPDGVVAPDMPKEVTDWRFHPADAPKAILSPAPEWLAYAQGHYDDVDAARAARPHKA